MGQSAARRGVAQAMRGILEPIGMFDARADELGPARALAAELIGPCIATEETLAAIYARSGYGVYVVREEGRVAGVLALIFLNAAGLAAIEDDSFDALAPRVDYAVLPHEKPAAIYAWGIAAGSRDAAKVLVKGSWALGQAVPRQPFFVRAATDAGRRLLTEKMNFNPYPGSTSGLLWSDRSDDQARRRAA